MGLELLKPSLRHEEQIFENFRSWMRPQEVSNLLGIRVKTIYDWKYRMEEKRVPRDLFVKLNGQLYLRKTVLLTWISSQNL